MPSILIHTESGLVAPEFGEELATHRRARKLLNLPAVPTEPATLYVLARRHARHERPMRVSVNGREIGCRSDGPPGIFLWTSVPIEPQTLIAGENRFDFWADSPAQDAWTLAMAAGHPRPGSFLSFDGGRAWQNEHMGVSHRL